MNTRLLKLLKVISLLSLTVISVQPVQAQSQCSFTQMSGTLIDFGIISAANTGDIIGIDNINFTCSGFLGGIVNYNISISTGSSGSFTSRTMRFGGRDLNYNLYRDALFMQIFGDGSNMGTQSFTVDGICLSGATCTVPVFGRIDGGQNLSSGQFSDSVQVTITF